MEVLSPDWSGDVEEGRGEGRGTGLVEGGGRGMGSKALEALFEERGTKEESFVSEKGFWEVDEGGGVEGGGVMGRGTKGATPTGGDSCRSRGTEIGGAMAGGADSAASPSINPNLFSSSSFSDSSSDPSPSDLVATFFFFFFFFFFLGFLIPNFSSSAGVTFSTPLGFLPSKNSARRSCEASLRESLSPNSSRVDSCSPRWVNERGQASGYHEQPLESFQTHQGE